MKLALLLEARFKKAPDGSVWSSNAYGHQYWARYLEQYEALTVVARVASGEPGAREVRSDGANVVFAEVPPYVGPWQYVRMHRRVRDGLRSALAGTQALVMRVPSQVANDALSTLAARRRPYGLEVVGDPWEVLAPGVVDHPLRPLLRRYFSWSLRRQCRSAAAVAYVTQVLKTRYGTATGEGSRSGCADVQAHGVYVYSDVVIPDGNPSKWGQRPNDGRMRVVFVGSLEQLYKGPDVLVKAIALCRREYPRIVLRMIGDGRRREFLERLARELGVADIVEWYGSVAGGDAVYRALRQSDVFVLPSRTEGLPRALIEAMAMGVPCLATRVGGVPELLADEDLLTPGDVEGLAGEIRAVLGDPERRARMIRRNCVRAADFHESTLLPRRRAFLGHVREATEAWLRTEAAVPR